MAYKIAIIVGSLREGSINKKVARSICALRNDNLDCSMIEIGDLLPEAHPLCRRIGVEVLVVERQIPDLDHRTVEIVVAQSADRPRDLAVDAALAKAADDDRDPVGH